MATNESNSHFSDQPLRNAAIARRDRATDVDVSVIIPSRAESSRAGLIERSIASVLEQENVRAVPTVVVNGNSRDKAVVERLDKRRDIRLLFTDGTLPEARLRGRDAVDTPFFAFLDDDDELLPRSIELRLQPMLSDESVDLVVSNGFRASSAGRIVTNPNICRFQRDPLRALVDTCWLNANAALFRTARIERDYFQNSPPGGFLEWTYLAFRLAQTKKIHFIDSQTFVTNDTPDSMSKSALYIRQHPAVLSMILNLPLPKDVRSRMERRYLSALHNASDAFLQAGDFRSAWSYHLKSLSHLTGWQYAPYTRQILWQQLLRLRATVD